jgi:hypothetical protein
MAPRRTLDARLSGAFHLYDALLDALDDETLARRLGDLPSNEIGHQLWCVVGARESYARAIERGEWSGFACSLGAGDTRDRSRVAAALHASAAAAVDVLAQLDELSAVQEDLAMTLLEHEAQHHGQLIRYLYGLRLPIPDAWKARYSLD